MITFILSCILFINGCSQEKVEHTDEMEEERIVGDNDQVNKSKEELDEEYEVTTTLDSDVVIDGTFIVDEDSMRIEATTNLLPGTRVKVDRYMEPFRNRIVMGMLTNDDTEVLEDGRIIVEMDSPSEYQTGKFIEVALQVTPSSQTKELEEIYGEKGENFTGPLVYQDELLGELYQKIFLPIYVFVEAEPFEMDLPKPERDDKPADYGDTEIWIDYELTNDHQFYYIEGNTNLIEGITIAGGYFTSKHTNTPQSWYFNQTMVEPDGSFKLRIAYTSQSPEGYIRVQSTSGLISRLSQLKKETYGEKFERMSGEYVEELDDGSKEIAFEIVPDPPQLAVPEETNFTSSEEELKVGMPDEVLFEFDSSELKAEASETLDEVIKVLEELPEGTVIHIDGHTDSDGDADYNQALSEARAAAVEAFIKEHSSIQHLDISAYGYGMFKPIDSNENEDGKARNRRVEVVINPSE